MGTPVVSGPHSHITSRHQSTRGIGLPSDIGTPRQETSTAALCSTFFDCLRLRAACSSERVDSSMSVQVDSGSALASDRASARKRFVATPL